MSNEIRKAQAADSGTNEPDHELGCEAPPPGDGSLALLLSELLPKESPSSAGTPAPVLKVGRLHGVDPTGRLLFLPTGSNGEPVPVTIGCAASDTALTLAAQAGQRALAVRPSGTDEEWVLMGLLRDRIVPATEGDGPQVSIDGESLRLSAKREIELRCGQASLLLRSDGRVVLKGAYVVSSSSGPNKVRGASITLN